MAGPLDANLKHADTPSRNPITARRCVYVAAGLFLIRLRVNILGGLVARLTSRLPMQTWVDSRRSIGSLTGLRFAVHHNGKRPEVADRPGSEVPSTTLPNHVRNRFTPWITTSGFIWRMVWDGCPSPVSEALLLSSGAS